MDADAGADDNDDGNDVDDDDDDDDDVDDATTILIVECVLLASAQVDANSGSLHCVFKLCSLKIGPTAYTRGLEQVPGGTRGPPLGGRWRLSLGIRVVALYPWG